MVNFAKAFGAVAVAGLVAAGAFAGSGSAAASAGDPMVTRCASDAYTVTTQPITNGGGGVVGQVQLRYSPRCGTNWARAVSYIGSAYLQADVASPSDYVWFTATSTSIYTDMVYAPNGTCARASASINNGPWSAYAVGC
ncbi:DUF2690 domain-containing protein [Actinosynnema sp. NPDC053489]|uniref:DUF2690 domain-containing protein n=1 Tax=Actinosynnema sp. NPDC053489 TaxID=3363916 RepID=UPI0037C9C395